VPPLIDGTARDVRGLLGVIAVSSVRARAGVAYNAAVKREPPPGYVLQSPDTDYETELRLFERWRTMPMDEKGALIAKLSRDLHARYEGEVRRRYPGAGDREVSIRTMASKYGKDLVRRTLGIEVPDEDVRFL
jgi:hypothetical protein